MSGARPIAPGPPGHFLLGNLREFRRDVLGLVIDSAKAYGDIVRCRLGPQIVHLLNHPDLADYVLKEHAENFDKNTRSSRTIRSIAGDSLLTCNGEFWQRQRRMDQPAFHHKQIAGFANIMTDVIAERLQSWPQRGAEGIDIASEMARLTYSIVGKTLFNFDTGKDAETVEEAMRTILPHIFNRLGSIILPPTWLPTPANRRFRAALDEVDEVVYRIIQEHREREAEGTSDNDLLGMLLRARDPDRGEGLNDTQLRNETITFLLAGHETTANALSWTFHLLGQHPRIMAHLVTEIDGVLGGRTPVLEDVPQLVFTKRVIQEAMRLYPPIWIIERRVIEDDVIGGYHVPAGSSIVVSPYALHRHPMFWDRPETFDPSRFETKPPAAYMPFGLGPRFCIGNEFAMLEAHLILAMVLQRFQLREVQGHPVEMMPDITLKPRHGVKMLLRAR